MADIIPMPWLARHLENEKKRDALLDSEQPDIFHSEHIIEQLVTRGRINES